MKKLLKVLLIALILINLYVVSFVLFFPGAYEPITGIVYCKTYLSCLHEMGHKLDYSKGLPSGSPEFHSLVDEFSKSNEVFGVIHEWSFESWYPKLQGHQYEEFYASLYMVYGGCVRNLPDEFQGFYK